MCAGVKSINVSYVTVNYCSDCLCRCYNCVFGIFNCMIVFMSVVDMCVCVYLWLVLIGCGGSGVSAVPFAIFEWECSLFSRFPW